MTGASESIRSVRDDVVRQVESGDLDRALRTVHDLVERIFTEPLCTSQVYGSRTLDDLCRCIGKASLARIGPDRQAEEAPGEPAIVYIVTKLQNSGGHNRLIADFIKAVPGARHIVLSTELAGMSDPGNLLQGLQPSAITFEAAPRGSYAERLAWLQRRLLQIRPARSYLFSHHQDSVAVAAIQPEMGLDAWFYHHGDHHLCLGVHAAHLKHIDPHPMGYHHCRTELGIDNFYVPLTSDDKGDHPAPHGFLAGGALTTCTAARSNKVEIPYFVRYAEIVPQLLQATGGKHVHIGRLTPWALFRIRRGLRSRGIAPERFVYIPWVPSVWAALQQHRVDLYVASFPYGGGLTLIEAMGAGIPVALHRHLFSRVLSGIDLAYPGAFSWRYPEELLQYCAAVTPGELAAAGRLGRAQYERFHQLEQLRRTLPDLERNSATPPELSGAFAEDSDERALWMERQVNLARVMQRAAYRLFRKLRAWR